MNFTTSPNCSSALRGTTTSNNNNPIQASSTSSQLTNKSHGSIKYIYELPFFERKELCRIFDENTQWETLGGGLMGYTSSELSEFGRAVFRGGSPTDALLTSWGNQNHTILELFTLLGRLTHFRGMKIIAKYVDPKYHTFIRDPDFQATQELVGIDPPPIPRSPVEVKVQNIVATNDKKSPNNIEIDTKNKEVLKDDKGKLASLSESVGLLPQIPYPELLIATNNWDRRNMLGKGGFGTVYKGIWKSTAVAIKRMEQRPNPAYVESQMKQSLGELRFLNSYRHDNILPLYGFSLEGDHPCLIYQFMTNGSLEDRLLCRQRTSPLSWHLRFHIAKGVACGIQFLHAIGTQPLIHGDIKSANILLDRNFEAKVGDFGLAREMAAPASAGASYVKVSRVHGTRPYLPDEYLRSKKLSTKVDTFSFGIVLFELATGQRAYEESRHKKFLRDMLEETEGNFEILKDPKAGLDNPDVFYILIKLGRNCTERIAKNRPQMVQVLKSLETSNPTQGTQASSIRTISTHVTGLPYLFESPYSRPGSLLIPASNSTTHRLSPEMRAGSPYWMPHGTNNGNYTGQRAWGEVSSAVPASSFVRRSPQPSPPLPGPLLQHYPNSGNNQNIQQNPLHSPGMTPVNLINDPNINPTSNNNNNTGPRSSNTNNNSQPHPASLITNQLNVDINSGGARPQLPEVVIAQPSPVPVTPMEGERGQQGLGIDAKSKNSESDNNDDGMDDDEMYLPLVLDHNRSDPCESVDVDGDGPATCIPLITELGIKDNE